MRCAKTPCVVTATTINAPPRMARVVGRSPVPSSTTTCSESPPSRSDGDDSKAGDGANHTQGGSSARHDDFDSNKAGSGSTPSSNEPTDSGQRRDAAVAATDARVQDGQDAATEPGERDTRWDEPYTGKYTDDAKWACRPGPCWCSTM